METTCADKRPAIPTISAVLVLSIAAAVILGGCTNPAGDDIATVMTDASSQEEVPSVQSEMEVAEDTKDPVLLRDDLEGDLCVVEYMGNSIAMIDSSTGEVLGRAPIGTNPAAVLADSGKLYVADSGGGELTVAHLGSDAQARRFRIGTQPVALAVDGTRGVVYAADYHLNSIRIVSMELDSLVGTVQLQAQGYESREIPPACCYNALDGTVLEGRKPVSLALSPDGSTLYCGNIGTYDISVIDLESSTEKTQYDGVIGMRDVVVTPDGEYLLVAGVGSDLIAVDSLVVEDASSGQTVAQVPVGHAVAGVAQSADGRKVVAVSRDAGTASLIDPSSWTVVALCQLDAGLADVTLTGDGKVAYVTNSALGTIYALDTDTMSIIWQKDGFADPRFIAVL